MYVYMYVCMYVYWGYCSLPFQCFTTWDPVAGPGGTPMPGNNSDPSQIRAAEPRYRPPGPNPGALRVKHSTHTQARSIRLTTECSNLNNHPTVTADNPISV